MAECPTCGAKMIFRHDYAQKFRHNGKCVTLKNLSGWYCNECKEIIYSGEEAKRIEKIVLERTKTVD